MKKILIIRDTPIHANEGIDKHCQALRNMFVNNKDLEILPVLECEGFYLKFIRKRIFNWNLLKHKINTSQCEIVHIHGFASLVVLQSIIAAKLCKKKIVYTAHFHPIETLDNPLFGKIFFFFLLRPLLRFVDAFIALNKEDAEMFSKYIKHVYQIPHWARLKPSIKKDNKKKNMILFVGRNKKNKGIEHLFSLPKNIYEIHCVCGDSTIDRDDFILHHNISEEELSNLYSQASLLVVPSKYEAFSLVALEAFMHNTPVLMSDKVRIADYLENINGYNIFKYGDFLDFQNKIPLTIGKQVDIDNISMIFSEERIKKLYYNLYSSL